MPETPQQIAERIALSRLGQTQANACYDPVVRGMIIDGIREGIAIGAAKPVVEDFTPPPPR